MLLQVVRPTLFVLLLGDGILRNKATGPCCPHSSKPRLERSVIFELVHDLDVTALGCKHRQFVTDALVKPWRLSVAAQDNDVLQDFIKLPNLAKQHLQCFC